MFKVSHSKIKTWRRCHKQYDYKYNQKLESRRKVRPLLFGSICHEMIEANANGDDPKDIYKKYEKQAKKLFSAERPDYLEVLNDANTLMGYYFKHYVKDRLKFIAIKGKLAEHEFLVEICKGIVLKGKIDAIMRDPEGRVWMTEHKTHKQIPTDSFRFRDLQTVIYTDAAPKIGIKQIDGVLWDYIRSKPPSVPELLKNGTLSKKKIDTLADVYLEAIKSNKLKPKDYADKIKELDGSERNFFKRIFMPLNEELAKQLMKETVETAKEMCEKAGIDKTRSINKDCDWCSFEPLCRAELLGIDADFIRKKEYVISDREENPNEETD